MCQVYVTRGAFIYLFSSSLELYSRRKKLRKKRNKRFLPLLSYFQKLSDNLQASPPFFPPIGFASLFLVPLLLLFFLSYLQTSKKKERSARVGRKEYVRNFFSEITYGTNKRSGMRANKSCVSFTLRMKRKYLYKGKCISDATRSLRVISMFRSLPEKLLFSTIK